MRTTPSHPSNVATAASTGRNNAEVAATTSVASTTLTSFDAETPGTTAMTTHRSAALTATRDSACRTRCRLGWLMAPFLDEGRALPRSHRVVPDRLIRAG